MTSDVFNKIINKIIFVATYIIKKIIEASIVWITPPTTPINKKPIWLIEEYAKNFRRRFSTNAYKAPNIIEQSEENQKRKDQIKYRSLNTNKKSLYTKINTTNLIGKTNNAITVCGLPS